jgi:hypothetical protein
MRRTLGYELLATTYSGGRRNEMAGRSAWGVPLESTSQWAEPLMSAHYETRPDVLAMQALQYSSTCMAST